MADPSPLELKAAADIRDDICRTYRAGLIDLGVADPNVTPGSDIYVLAQAIGDQLEIGMANVQVMADKAMPDTATGDDLDRLVANMPMDPRKIAVGARGFIIHDATAATVINAGDQLTGGNGFRYAVDTTASYGDGDEIAITGVDAGEDSNLGEGETLRWVTIPAYATPTVLTSTGGLDGGREDEKDEELRARLLAVYRNPPRSGNTGDVIKLAEESSPSVQKAFAYPAPQGPGTFAVAVTGAPTTTSKNRDIATATVTGTVKPYVDGNLAEHAFSIVNTVTNVNEDVALGIQIPTAKTASPSGPGGGWKNGTPFPQPLIADGRCAVSVVTSTTDITIGCAASATALISEIAWLSPIDWMVYRAKVTSVTSFTSNLCRVVLDRPLPGIAIGHFISPDAENVEAYFQSVLDSFALMGPGELTANGAILAYAYRRPIPSQSWPSTTGGHILRAMVNDNAEVDDAEYLYRLNTTPAAPAAVTDPPNILVPRNIGLYPVPTT